METRGRPGKPQQEKYCESGGTERGQGGNDKKIKDNVEKIISQGLGLSGNEFEIERAHRSLAPITCLNQPPRTMLMRL